MRVLHFIDYFQPEVGYQETFLAREHAKLGHDVYVVTSDRYSGMTYSKKELHNRASAGFFTEEGIRVYRLKSFIKLPHIIWISGLEQAIQSLKPDVVIVHEIANFSAFRIARLKRKMNFRLIFDDHMTSDNSLSAMRFLYPVFEWLFSPAIQKSADALVAILPETRTFMHEKYGIPLERISVIPLGADDQLFRFEASARAEIRSKLSIPEGLIVFMYTGKIIAIKKLPALIAAMRKLAVNHDNIRLAIIGDGEASYIDELKKQVKEKGLEDKIVWHDAVPNEQLYRFYSAADAAVWPCGPSISMREAMSCGLPLIIGENSKVLELLGYNNGFSYPEGDIDALAERMEKLLDPGLRSEMGANSRKLVEDKFNWRTIARQFLEV